MSLINPRNAIENGWLQFPEWMDAEFREKCIQPNAVDFTIDRVFVPTGENLFFISEQAKQMRDMTELHTEHKSIDESRYWRLDGHRAYDFMSDFHVTVPQGVAALLIVRSTFNRNGLFVTSGLYDSGFDNKIGACLHNRGDTAFVAPRTRVGQIMFVESDSAKLYAGVYNDNAGQHWSSNGNKVSV